MMVAFSKQEGATAYGQELESEENLCRMQSAKSPSTDVLMNLENQPAFLR